MSTALKKQGEPYTPTHLSWSFLDYDGKIWHRYTRNLSHELHLVGIEEPINPEHRHRMSGRWIKSGGQMLEVRRFFWSFEIDDADRVAAQKVVDEMSEYFPKLPPSPLIQSLLLLSKSTPNPSGLQIAPEEIAKIADKVEAKLNDRLQGIFNVANDTRLQVLAKNRKRWWQP